MYEVTAMSEGFRCDGCDKYYGGTPTEVSIGTETGTVGLTEIVIGHAAGRDDACPADGEPIHTVRWPFVGRSTVDFCATCTAEFLVPALQDAAKQGRFGPEQEVESDE